jgi:tetratricopeptide (TPR) repeat protein
VKEYQEVIRLKPDHIEALTELAGVYIQAQDAGPALRYAERALAFGLANPAARLVRTAAWALQGRYPEVRPELVRLQKEYPNLKQAKLQMAMLLVAEKKYAEAESLFRAYYLPGQGDVGSLRGLVALYMEQGKPDKALVAVQQEYAALPTSAALRRLLVTTATASGDIRLATEVAEKIVASDPGSSEAALQLGTLHQRQGRLDKAIELFRQAAVLDTKSGAPPALLGDALVEAGKPEDAIAAYRQSLRLDPANPATMNNLAFQLADTGRDLDEAANLAQRAAQQLSDNPAAIDTMGYIYLKQGRYDSALQTLRRAVALAPRSAGIRIHLAMALLGQGNREAARRELQGVLSTAEPGSRDVVRAKQLMGRL